MKTSLDCVPCLFRQVLDAGRGVTGESDIHWELLQDAARMLIETDRSVPPPVLAARVHRRIREIAGGRDPWADIRRRQNSAVMAVLPELEKMIEHSVDRLETAVRLAIAGNIIDLGAGSDPEAGSLLTLLKNYAEEPLQGDMDTFRVALSRAENVLYLADNAGEFALDRLLVSEIGPVRVTVAVRGAPVLNDVVMDDAVQVGLDRIVRVISNGSDVPGTVPGACGEEFREAFFGADLVIAKGQGNFETLCDEMVPIVFLLKVKCPAVATLTGLEVGSQACLPGGTLRRGGGVR